jgi:hypothetical protein
MAMQIRSEFELPTLRILLAPRRDSATEALFQVVRGSETPRDVARCSLRELGLPNTLSGMQPVSDYALTIPRNVVAELVSAVADVGESPLPPNNALWLEFPSPRGFLYIMPWERLLAPLGRRLFRLPNHLIRPQAPRRTLEVAFCASSPMAKIGFDTAELVDELVRQYRTASAREVKAHIFTDQDSFEQVAGRFSEHGDHAVVHDPSTAAHYSPPAPSVHVRTSAQLSNPWLLWIRDAMQSKPLDFVHFVSHGYMSGDQGAIAMAMSPTINTDEGLSRFIGSVELSTFLSQVGAWGLALTGPNQNYSEVGLRELADAIAMIRPGVTITHDRGNDSDCRQLGLVLRSVLDPQPGPADIWSAVTCWVHPKFVDYPDEYRDDLHVNADGSSAFIPDATKQALAGEGTEAWVASATRVLETQQVRWLPDSMDEPIDEAAVTALRNVADLVDRHVKRSYGEGG